MMMDGVMMGGIGWTVGLMALSLLLPILILVWGTVFSAKSIAIADRANPDLRATDERLNNDTYR